MSTYQLNLGTTDIKIDCLVSENDLAIPTRIVQPKKQIEVIAKRLGLLISDEKT